MRSTLFTLGNFYTVKSFGFFMFMGIGVFILSIYFSKEIKKYMSDDDFLIWVFMGTLVALLGGKIYAYLADYPKSVPFFNNLFGGLSMVGSIPSVIIYGLIYCWYYRIPTLAYLDLIAAYVPIVHIFIRIGCFFAGCCCGLPTKLWWGVIYTDPQCHAPLHVAIHPTQLYSIAALMLIFIILQYCFHKKVLRTGQILFLYMILISIKRFSLDFLRNDRVFSLGTVFSTWQWGAMIIFSVGLICFLSKSKEFERSNIFVKEI